MARIAVGSIINFTCPFELILSGPNSTVCTMYGQWEPDPKEVECTLKGLCIYVFIVIMCYTVHISAAFSSQLGCCSIPVTVHIIHK